MKNFCKIIFALSIYLFSAQAIRAQAIDTAACPYDCCRPDGHAPFGVMSDHIHGKGKFLVSYTFMNMMMNGNQTGTAKTSDADLMMNYAMAPGAMTMNMHMIMFGYGITSKLTVMAMINFNSNSMNMNMDPDMGMAMHGMAMSGSTADSTKMSSTSSGLGDTKIYGLYMLMDKRSQRLIANLGIGLPTGSIKETGMTVLGDKMKLPYNMQLGSGSFALIPGLTYIGQMKKMSWGAAAYADLKTGANSEGYMLGNTGDVTAWFSYKFCNWISASVRAEYWSMGAIKGYDKDIALMENNDPTANTANYGGTRTTLLPGVNFYVPKGTCKELRIGLEYAMPVMQNLNGTQMTMKSGFIAGIQYLFM